jgi:maleate isomerase
VPARLHPVSLHIAAVTRTVETSSTFHPIYDLPSAGVETALAAMDLKNVDAVVMLGTGMPALGPILDHVGSGTGVPIISCMSALAWRSLAVFDLGLAEESAMRRYFAGDGWRERFGRAVSQQ